MRVWDAANGQEALSLKGHTDRIHGVAFSPYGQHIVSASDDMRVRVWDARPLGLAERQATLPLMENGGPRAALGVTPMAQTSPHLPGGLTGRCVLPARRRTSETGRDEHRGRAGSGTIISTDP